MGLPGAKGSVSIMNTQLQKSRNAADQIDR